MPDTAAAGRRLVRFVVAILEHRGYLVETARNVVIWVRDPTTGKPIPRSAVHDYFRVWDLIAVNAEHRMFAQVTTLRDVAHRRAKILTSKFPASADDVLLGYVPGRSRHFRVWRGPSFDQWTGETWRPLPALERRVTEIQS